MCVLVYCVPGVIGVNERALRLGVVIVLVVILLGLPGSVHSHSVGAVLSSAGNVVTTQDPETTIKLNILTDIDAV